MKIFKLSSIILSALMLLSLAGCGSDKPNDVTPVSASADEVQITTTAETTAAIPQIDCFEGVEITLSGISPNGKLTIDKENASQEIRKWVSFSSDLSSGIHNGDTIVVTASYDDGTVRYQQTKEIEAELWSYLTIEDVRNGAELKLSTDDEATINDMLISQSDGGINQYLGTDRENWSDFIWADFNRVENITLDKIYYTQYEEDFYIHLFYTIIANYDVNLNYTNAQRLKTIINDNETGMQYYYFNQTVPASVEYTGESTVSYPLVGHVAIEAPLVFNGEVSYQLGRTTHCYGVTNPYSLNASLNPEPGYDVFDDISRLNARRNFTGYSEQKQELIDYVETTP
jgi:hypothetical protein